MTIIDSFGSNSIVEIILSRAPSILETKTIYESKIKGKHNINILSIKRNKRHIEISRNTLIQKYDVLLVFGSYSYIKGIFYENINFETTNTEQLNKNFNELELIDNYGNKATAEIIINTVPIILENKSLINSFLKKYGINIMFIKRNEETIEVDKDTIVLIGDVIVVFGPYQAIKNIFLY